jgi:hypothetical protein
MKAKVNNPPMRVTENLFFFFFLKIVFHKILKLDNVFGFGIDI